jgi:hypothetical protein
MVERVLEVLAGGASRRLRQLEFVRDLALAHPHRYPGHLEHCGQRSLWKGRVSTLEFDGIRTATAYSAVTQKALGRLAHAQPDILTR